MKNIEEFLFASVICFKCAVKYGEQIAEGRCKINPLKNFQEFYQSNTKQYQNHPEYLLFIYFLRTRRAEIHDTTRKDNSIILKLNRNDGNKFFVKKKKKIAFPRGLSTYFQP